MLLLENVEGLKYAGKDEGLQLLLSELDGHQQGRGHFVRALTSTFSTPPISACHSCASACSSWHIETAGRLDFRSRRIFREELARDLLDGDVGTVPNGMGCACRRGSL